MGKGIAIFEYGICMACCVCGQSCPFSFISESKQGLDRNRKAYPELKPGHRCTGCGICAAACPLDCIVIGESG